MLPVACENTAALLKTCIESSTFLQKLGNSCKNMHLNHEQCMEVEMKKVMDQNREKAKEIKRKWAERNKEFGITTPV